MSRPAPKILVVGPAWVGDMVMAQVMLRLIKQHQPDVQLDVLAPPWTQPLLSFMPEVHQGIVSPFGHGQLALRQRWQLGRALRACGYQQAIVLPNSFKAAIVPWAAAIAQRTGWRGEMRWGLLNDVRYLDKIKFPRMVQRFAALALQASNHCPQALPRPALVVKSWWQQSVLEQFALSIPAKPILALCPGAEYGPAKRWPASKFAEVAKVKQAQGWDIWIFGSAKDFPAAEQIQHALPWPVHNFAGRTSLFEAVTLMSLASHVLTNDSGLMHVASALNIPLTAVYGSSSPVFTPPLGERSHIVSLKLPCSPCFARNCPLGHLRCLLDLPIERVLATMP